MTSWKKKDEKDIVKINTVSRTKVACYLKLSMQRPSFKKKFYVATAHVVPFQAKSGLAS